MSRSRRRRFRSASRPARAIPYGHQWIDDEDVRSVVAALRSDRLTQGPKVEEFEKAAAHACGAKYAVACVNGTAALHLACLAAGLKPGDEAITSPITFVATSNAVLYCGAKPVFADVEPDTINLDAADAARKLTARTKAILPVHFAGQPCDMEAVAKLAVRRKLTVIEDASHALGARYRGKPIGSGRWSDMTTLSFHPVKHITTGEGGMVLTHRKDLYDRLRLYRTHGITKDSARLRRHDGPWYHEMHALGYNYRITDLQCALGISQLKKLPRFIERRRAIAARYQLAFSENPALILPVERPDRFSAYHLYPIQLRDASRRRWVFENLRRRGIEPQVHYIPVHTQPYYRDHVSAKTRCPNAERYYSRAITIPLYPSMTDAEVGRVIVAVEESVA